MVQPHTSAGTAFESSGSKSNVSAMLLLAALSSCVIASANSGAGLGNVQAITPAATGELAALPRFGQHILTRASGPATLKGLPILAGRLPDTASDAGGSLAL